MLVIQPGFLFLFGTSGSSLRLMRDVPGQLQKREKAAGCSVCSLAPSLFSRHFQLHSELQLHFRLHSLPHPQLRRHQPSEVMSWNSPQTRPSTTSIIFPARFFFLTNNHAVVSNRASESFLKADFCSAVQLLSLTMHRPLTGERCGEKPSAVRVDVATLPIVFV